MASDTPFRSWGITWTGSMRHSIDHDCENCKKWSFSPGAQEDRNQIVGFEYAPEPGLLAEKIGKLIVECPSCGEKLWWHIRTDGVRALLQLRDLGLLPSWPIETRGGD